MNCEKCQQKQASVHITQIINGEKQETHLCDQCAQAMKVNLGIPQFPLNNLTNLFGFLTMSPQTVDTRIIEDKCPNCASTFAKIGEVGYVGCSECYRHFASQLEPVLRKVHGPGRHRGKIPRRMGTSFILRKEAQELKAALKQAVDREAYEEAARIRDQIKALEERIARGDQGD